MQEESGRLLSHHLGRALQLTNILRDIDEDAAIGRMYLPREPLLAAGIALDTPAQVAADPRLDVAGREVAARARAHFGEANRIMAARPRGHLIAPRLMERVYAGVLERMEITGWAPPRRRARVDKLGLLLTLVRLQLTR